jgi:hypothetical protein
MRCLKSILAALLAAPAVSLIDRQEVVTRHAPSLQSINTSEVAVLGNGAFALSVDVTGLQTLNTTFSGVSPPGKKLPHWDVYFPLVTSADWAWHSTPPPKPGSAADPFAPPGVGKFWDRWRVSSNRTTMHESWYATAIHMEGTVDSDAEEAVAWRSENPHRLGLGQIALRKLDPAGNTLSIDAHDIGAVNQTLDLWAGEALSRFNLNGTPIEVRTAVHGEADMVAVKANSTLISEGLLGVALSFAAGTSAKPAMNWTDPDSHQTEVLSSNTTSALIRRTLDYDQYLVRVSWSSSSFELRRVGPHAFVVAPKRGAASVGAIEVSVMYAPARGYGLDRFLPSMPNTSEVGGWLAKRWALAQSILSASSSGGQSVYGPVAASGALRWQGYWQGGGMIDFMGNSTKAGAADHATAGDHATAWELERRVILSLYLTGAQEAGFCFTSESGLIQNSWSGKFHMEMKWWHTAHFALWGRPHLLGRTNLWYPAALQNATWYAKTQGYRGARWGKETGPQFNAEISNNLRTVCGGGLLLVWNQVHPIYLAELEYRAALGPEGRAEVLQRMAAAVNASAEFMSDFASRGFDSTTGRYQLGPPLMSSSEHGEEPGTQHSGCGTAEKPCCSHTYNPTYELTYWRVGLSIAAQWRKRLGLPPNPEWADVYARLDNPPTVPSPWDKTNTTRLYTLHAGCKNLYVGKTEGCAQRSDHPGHLMAYGILPGDAHGIDVRVMNDTFTATAKVWDLEHGYYGTDVHIMAISAARLGRPEDALHFLMLNSDENRYSKMGHNLNFAKVAGYLPGNGALLQSVAVMAAGWGEESEQDSPGFPAAWKPAHEGLVRIP